MKSILPIVIMIFSVSAYSQNKISYQNMMLLGIVSVEKFCFLKRKWLKNKTR